MHFLISHCNVLNCSLVSFQGTEWSWSLSWNPKNSDVWHFQRQELCPHRVLGVKPVAPLLLSPLPLWYWLHSFSDIIKSPQSLAPYSQDIFWKKYVMSLYGYIWSNISPSKTTISSSTLPCKPVKMTLFNGCVSIRLCQHIQSHTNRLQSWSLSVLFKGTLLMAWMFLL